MGKATGLVPPLRFRRLLAIPALLLSISALAQGIQAPPPEQTLPIGPFTDGLYTRYSANIIPDGALTEATNVLLDEDIDGVVVRRAGYSKCNTTALANSKTVRGSWQFDASDGTKYHVVVSSEVFYQHDGDCAFTAIPGLAGFNAAIDWDCTQALGKLWCTNGATTFSWDGASTATISAAPAGTLIDNFRNRILIADITGNKSRVRASGELDGGDWVGGSNSTSPVNIAIGGVNDGAGVTCMMGTYGDAYIIGKRDSLYGLYGFDYNDFQLRELSREVGCIDDKTVREKDGCLMWLSKRGVESMCGPNIQRVSDPIRDQIDGIIQSAGNARSATDSSQAQFQAGNLLAAGNRSPLDAVLVPGSVALSTWSKTDFTDTVLSKYDAFDDGEFYTSPAWSTVSAGGYPCEISADKKLRGNTTSPQCTIKTDWDVSVGTWSIDYQTTVATMASGSYGTMFWFLAPYYISSTTNRGYVLMFSALSGVLDLYVYKIENGFINGGVAIEGDRITLSTATSINVKVTRNSSGLVVVHVDDVLYGSATITDITSGTVMAVEFRQANALIDNISPPTSSYTSPPFDTGFSTSIWGAISETSTTVNGSSIAFHTATSSSCSGTFSDFLSVSAGTVPVSASGGCIKYKALAGSTTGYIYLSSTTLTAGTTGQFISQCFNPGASITSWGRFGCTTTPYDGTYAYAISTGTTCNQVTRTSATWTNQTNNNPIGVATSAYVAYRFTPSLSLFVSTGNPTVHDCTINWNEGESRPPLASIVYRDRYHLSYTSSSASGAYSDHQLVFDKKGRWTLFDDMNCYSLGIYERRLYCGSSTANGQVYLMDSGTDDDGAAFTSRFKTKAYHMGDPSTRKTYRLFGAELEPEPDASYDIAPSFNYYLDRGTTPFSLSTVDLGEDADHLLWAQIPFSTDNPVSSRYIQLEGQIAGVNKPFRFYRGLLRWSPLRQD